MLKTSLLPRIILILGALAMAVMACSLAPTTTQPPSELEVTSTYPTNSVEQGRSFDVVVNLSNTSQYNAHVTEIRLPASFLSKVNYLGSEPALTLTNNASGDGILAMDLTIAPTGLERFIFRFEAITTGSLSGLGVVATDDGSYQFTLQASVVGVNPSEWQPGTASTATPASLGKVPFQAVVQIKALVSIDGENQVGWTGSGTIITTDGLILTNAHVVLSDRFYQVQDLIVALTLAQDSPPVDTYYASIVQADAALDIAVIKPRTDMQGNPLNYDTLNLPAVPIGNSDNLTLGDEIVILGYPGIGGDTITLTRGEVSGFTSEGGYGNRAFIKTSATIAGGNSGGLAVNQNGELVGVPTQVGSGDLEGAIVDCRPLADTNRDGYVDDYDTCVPTGGFINALRPVNLATSIIQAAKAGQVAIQADTTMGETYQSTGKVIFEDDFSDPNSGWSTFESENGLTRYENGELVIHVLSTDYLVWSDVEYAYDNVSMEVDARVLNPVGDSDFGFICGEKDNDHFTVLEISEDGYYTIWKQNGEEYVSLVDWTYADTIAAGGPFKLSATCGTQGLVLAVNGLLLAEIQDATFVPGLVGLVGGTFGNTGFKVAFDNFQLLIP